MRIRIVFLLNCPLILYQFKYKGVGIILKKKKSKQVSSLNNSIG